MKQLFYYIRLLWSKSINLLKKVKLMADNIKKFVAKPTTPPADILNAVFNRIMNGEMVKIKYDSGTMYYKVKSIHLGTKPYVMLDDENESQIYLPRIKDVYLGK